MTHFNGASRPQASASLWLQLAAQVAAIAGVAMITFGLIAAGSSDAWAQSAQRADIGAWAVRCLAAAMIAGGQVIFVLGVIPAFFPRRGAARGSLELGFALSMALLALLGGVASAALAAAAGW